MSNLKDYYRKDLQLAACGITGISITVGIPNIPHKVLEYQNPLALIENARGIAELPKISIMQLSPEVISGTLLCLLSHLELISDHLSATQRNILLQDVHKHYLYEALHLFSKVTRKQKDKLPLLSLSFHDEELRSKTAEKIKNYTQVCHSILFPAMDIKREVTVYSTTYKAKEVELESYLTPEVKKEFKSLASTMRENKEIKDNIYNLLSHLATGKHLVNMETEFRKKLISKLEIISSVSSNRMIQILSAIEKNLNIEEIIFIQNDRNEDEISAMMPVIKKRTLAEILASKVAKPPAELASPESIISSNNENEEF